jgi:hypothetical protein
MMDIMIGIPPIHPATATSSDVMFWAMIGLLVVLFLVATILWVVGSRRIAQRQSRMKEAGQQYEASPQPQGDGQPEVHSWREETLLRR